MKEIFLLKLGEIVLKGANKRQFESRLRQNVRRRMKLYGNFDVYLMQSTVYVEPMDENAMWTVPGRPAAAFSVWYPCAAAVPVRRIWMLSLKPSRITSVTTWTAQSPSRWRVSAPISASP